MRGRRSESAAPGRDGLRTGAAGVPGTAGRRVSRVRRCSRPSQAPLGRRRVCPVRPRGSCGARRVDWEMAVGVSPLLSERAAWCRSSVEWFSELFGAEDFATVVLRDRRGPGSRQLARAAGHWCHPSGQRLLRSANDAGSDVFCSVNPTVRGSSRSVSEVRRLQVEFDTDGNERIRKLMTDAKSGRTPMPAVVVRSSAGRWQVLWHVEPAAWTLAGAEEANRRLASAYGGDPAVVDVTRVMRVPGFLNRKPGRADAPVALVPRSYYDPQGVGAQWWEPKAFARVIPPRRSVSRAAASREPSSRPAAPERYVGGRRVPASQSEVDWHAVVDALRGGESPGVLIQELAEFRDDKANPRDYAERTVVRACRSLGVREPETDYGRRHPVEVGVPGR